MSTRTVPLANQLATITRTVSFTRMHMSTTMMLITMTARRISDRRARRPTLLNVGIAVVRGVTGVIDVTSMFDRVRLLRST